MRNSVEPAGRPSTKKRLQVTEAERLRYSRRRLRALSRLREAGIEPEYSMYKEHPLPSSTRLGYRVRLPYDGHMYFPRLSDVEAFAADYRRWQQTQAQPFTMRIAFAAWQNDPMQQMMVLVKAGRRLEQETIPVYKATYVPPAPTRCMWPECQALANGAIQGQALCVPHAILYGKIAHLAQRASRR